MTAPLLTLAERVEAAAKPDRELDALIRCALFAPPGAYVEQSAINGAWVVYSGTESRSGRPHVFEHWPSQEVRLGAFTASIDSALTLVPEGAGLTIARYWIGRVDHPVWSAEIATGGVPENPRQVFDCYDTPNAALAISAAALRARATLPPSL